MSEKTSKGKSEANAAILGSLAKKLKKEDANKGNVGKENKNNTTKQKQAQPCFVSPLHDKLLIHYGNFTFT